MMCILSFWKYVSVSNIQSRYMYLFSNVSCNHWRCRICHTLDNKKEHSLYALPVQTQNNVTNSSHELHSNMASSTPGNCFVPVKPT
jgi:hypothetical protein